MIEEWEGKDLKLAGRFITIIFLPVSFSKSSLRHQHRTIYILLYIYTYVGIYQFHIKVKRTHRIIYEFSTYARTRLSEALRCVKLRAYACINCYCTF